VHNLFYLAMFAKMDDQFRDRPQIVVLANRLPHNVNTYHEAYRYQVVCEANGRSVGSLRDLVQALQQPTNGFHVIRFDGSPDPLVLDAAQMPEADRQIGRRYEIPSMTRLR